MWLLNFGSFGEQGSVLILQSIPQRPDRVYLLFYADCLVVMNVFFITANLAIVWLGLILRAVLHFAEVDHFIPATRTIRHYFDLIIVSHGPLGYIGVNHVSVPFSLYIFNILYK
jgi:hypothetical protein